MFSRDFKADLVNARNSEFLRGLNRPQNQTFSAVADVTFLIFLSDVNELYTVLGVLKSETCCEFCAGQNIKFGNFPSEFRY